MSVSQLFVERHARHELQQQALFERARADARRVEPLHDAQRFFGERQLLGAMRLRVAIDLGRQRRQQVFERRLQIAVRVEAVDDPLGHPADRRRRDRTSSADDAR